MKKRFVVADYDRRKIGKCGKVCFDKRTAETKRNYLLKLGREEYLRIYNCPICNCWHLTKKHQ